MKQVYTYDNIIAWVLGQSMYYKGLMLLGSGDLKGESSSYNQLGN